MALDPVTARHIEQAAAHAAEATGAPRGHIEEFLLTGDSAWPGSGSGRFTWTDFHTDSLCRSAALLALKRLFDSLAGLLPSEVRSQPSFPPEAVRARLEPMVTGMLPAEWRETALREVTARFFVLDFQGTRAAIAAEGRTCMLSGAQRVLWAFLADHGIEPPAETKLRFDGMAGDFAHIRASVLNSGDPYCDVVVHEGAHMLHLLKPAHHGLTVRRGQERFVDVEFKHRELFAYSCEAYSRVLSHGPRKARIAFAERMPASAFSFSSEEIGAVSELVLAAAKARNGWRAIRDAVIQKRVRGKIA